MHCSASHPAASVPAAPEAPAHPASPSPWRLRPATSADAPALVALGPGCYTTEQAAARASFGGDLAGFAGSLVEADTWETVETLGLSMILNGNRPTLRRWASRALMTAAN